MQENLESKKFDYNTIETIRKTIVPQKHIDRYSMHMYFTRRPYNVVQDYIKHFCKQDDIVLDPFVGTGVTAVESLISRRKSISVDLAPLSTFITRMIALAPVDIENLDKDFLTIKNNLQVDINKIYRLSNNNLENDFKKIIRDNSLFYPNDVKLPQIGSAQATKGYLTVDQLFSKKQLISLSMILKEINNVKKKDNKDLLKFAFSSTLHYTNKMFRPEKTASGPTSVYRYWVPKNISDVNVWDYFERRYKLVVKGKKETNNLIGNYYKENDTFKIFNRSATELTKYIPENSIDYIFTDPPYGANIAYLDLSTMWNAWLGFKISEKDKEMEVIEGGQLKKTQQNYVNLLSQSFEEMYEVLKKDRWMSVVFHHKELKLWNAIKNEAERAGFRYINAVSQPSVKSPTFRKIQSPLRALSGELIINFRKTQSKGTIVISLASNVKSVILNTAERLIVQNNGTTTDDIYQAIIPELLDANLLDLAVKEINDINPILKEEFELDVTNKWHIKTGKKIGELIPKRDKIRFYLSSMLKREGQMDLDNIISIIMPLLVNGHQPDSKEIMDVLDEIAEPIDGKWRLKKEKIEAKQTTFLSISKELPNIKFDINNERKNHNQMIVALANLAKLMKYKVWIGRKEQGENYEGIKLKDFCDYEKLPILELKKEARKIIEQIDIIWFNNDIPVAAFEIENSTNVQTGIMRFVNLIKKEPLIASKLYILAPDTRRNKVESELKNPGFIGDPLYIERKVKYILYSEFINLYNSVREDLKVNLYYIDRISRGVIL